MVSVVGSERRASRVRNLTWNEYQGRADVTANMPRMTRILESIFQPFGSSQLTTPLRRKALSVRISKRLERTLRASLRGT